MPNEQQTIFVLVQGGVVQNIWSTDPGSVRVILVDQDDGSSLDEVVVHDPYQVDQATLSEINQWVGSWQDLREQLPNSDDE